MASSVFPPAAGAANLIGIPDYQVFADPSGSDGGRGTLASPYRTLYKAASDVVAHGGGTLSYNDGCTVGGPVAGQGLWFRGDGWDIPGWLGDVPMVIQGNGQSSGSPFSFPGAASMYGPDNTALTPLIWFAQTAKPKVLSNVFSNLTGDSFSGLCCPIRVGWDYNRNNDGTNRQLLVENADRADGETVFTVTLPAGYTVISGTRGTVSGVANTVTLRVQLPSNMTYSPWYTGAIVRVVTSDATFPSIDATVTGQSDAFALHVPGQIVELTYVQSGSPVASFTPITGGTITGHGVQAKDRVYLNSSSSEFPTCWGYRCTAATVDTITVTDVYGYSPRSAAVSENDIGYLLKQERGRCGSVAVSMYNVVVRNSHTVDDSFEHGPTIDFGSADAVGMKLNKCYLEGYTCTGVADENIDRDRTWCAVLADPGIGASSASVYDSFDNSSSDGNIRFYGGAADNLLSLRGWLQDTGAGTKVSPTVQIVEGNTFSKVILDGISNADASAGQPAVEDIAQIGPGRLWIGPYILAGALNLVDGSCNGPGLMDGRLFTVNGAVSPWKRGWHGLWPGVTLTAPHVGANRKDAISSPRGANLWTPVANWEDAVPLPGGVTVTENATGPFGQSNAIKIVSAGAAQITVGVYPHIFPGSGTGGYIAFGCWVNSPDGSGLADAFFNIGQYGNLRIDGSASLVARPHIYDNEGWQWIRAFGKITSDGTDRNYAQLLNVPAGEINLWGPTLVFMPASTGDADAYEWFNTFTAQPLYLPAGMSGTFEGDKFIAHGGIGGPSPAVTLEALPNGSVAPYYDAAGNLLGYFQLYDEA